MSKLPDLYDYQKSLEWLRQSLRPLGRSRFLGSKKLANDLQWSAVPKPYGASTGILKYGDELKLYYIDKKIIYEQQGSELFSVNLVGESQKSVMDKVFAKYKEYGVNYAQDPQKENSEEIFNFNGQAIEKYLQVQNRMLEALNKVRTQLKNPNPVALWPHGFDLSFLWFKQGLDEHVDPHMNFGFSPGFGESEPYIYFYAWPTPEDLTKYELPHGAKWQKTWSAPGAQIPYSVFSKLDNPQDFITDLLMDLYGQNQVNLGV